MGGHVPLTDRGRRVIVMLMKLLGFDGVCLAIDEFGDPSVPPVLLIAGATQSMDWWDEDFCALLAAKGLHVIRFDHRDTGQSTTSPPGRPGYSGIDLATDPLRILDALGLGSAHFAGVSMGGAIAQHLGVHAAPRVRSLTLIESSLAGGRPGPLPPPSPELAEAEARLQPVEDWTDAVAVIDYRAEAARPYAGSAGFDDERFRAIAWSEQARSACVESSLTNHFLVADSPEADPAAISAPSLIVHSESDPLFPLPHGAALAQMIPNATLLRVDSMGHGTPPPHTWSVIVPALIVHCLANDEAAHCRNLHGAGTPEQEPL